jgi:acyl carrier protein
MIGGTEADCLTTQVIAIVRKAGKIPGKVVIRPESRLVEDLAIDSLDLVSLILQFQDRFDVVFDEDAVPNLCRVADIVDYLDASREAPGGFKWQDGRSRNGMSRAAVNE